MESPPTDPCNLATNAAVDADPAATMPRESLSTLPLELKEKLVKMASDQEDAWLGREVGPAGQEELAKHVNGLSSLALVNKEFRELAAKHQFKVSDRHSSLYRDHRGKERAGANYLFHRYSRRGERRSRSFAPRSSRAINIT